MRGEDWMITVKYKVALLSFNLEGISKKITFTESKGKVFEKIFKLMDSFFI